MILLLLATSIGGYMYLNPKLPSIEGLSDVQLQVPLRIYSSDGALMERRCSFGPILIRITNNGLQ